jgi:hypothetical protein
MFLKMFQKIITFGSIFDIGSFFNFDESAPFATLGMGGLRPNLWQKISTHCARLASKFCEFNYAVFPCLDPFGGTQRISFRDKVPQPKRSQNCAHSHDLEV